MPASETITRVLRRAQWIVVPLLVLGLAEGFVRATADRVPAWYGAADRLAAARPIQALFVGSSRVEAAILPAAFEEVLAAHGRPGGMALNLGRGYTTEAEHFFGVRNLLSAHPGNLRGVTVFVEALGGLPFDRRWDFPWALAEQPWLLVDLLRLCDLPGFWWLGGLDFDTRLHVSVRVAFRPFALLDRRERMREKLLDQGLPAVAQGRSFDSIPTRILGDDLRGRGQTSSIRTDPAVLAPARALAERAGDELLRAQKPMREWNGTIAEAFVRLVQSAGGHVVFFGPPLSAPFLAAYRTEIRREDAAVFARQARVWGACVVRPDFTYSDDDLPDLWHLRLDRAAEYTRALALTWLETCPAAR